MKNSLGSSVFPPDFGTSGIFSRSVTKGSSHNMNHQTPLEENSVQLFMNISGFFFFYMRRSFLREKRSTFDDAELTADAKGPGDALRLAACRRVCVYV